jgi:hypothetical protein
VANASCVYEPTRCALGPSPEQPDVGTAQARSQVRAVGADGTARGSADPAVDKACSAVLASFFTATRGSASSDAQPTELAASVCMADFAQAPCAGGAIALATSIVSPTGPDEPCFNVSVTTVDSMAPNYAAQRTAYSDGTEAAGRSGRVSDAQPAGDCDAAAGAAVPAGACVVIARAAPEQEPNGAHDDAAFTDAAGADIKLSGLAGNADATSANASTDSGSNDSEAASTSVAGVCVLFP